MVERMDQALILAVAVFFGVAAAALWASSLGSRKAKPEKREVGYQRGEIIINPNNVPEFKPTWREKRNV